jgi:general secretion pathway protein G
MKRKQGFTLIEVLVAATIIAILTAVGMVSYTNINKRSRDTKRRSDMEQIRSALEMYRADNGSYANTGGGSWSDASNLSTTLVSSYMSAIPSDPKSTTQTYRYQATNLVSGNYYGYCLSSLLESENPSDTCTPDTVNTHNYGLKSP